jgi:hypothetical protein
LHQYDKKKIKMMQAESAEIQVHKTMAKKLVMNGASSLHSEEGPDDEFRPVKISVVTTTRVETRDEGDAIALYNENEIRLDGDDERESDERETYEDNGREKPADSPSVHTNDSNEEDHIKTVVSELTTDFKNESATPLEPEGEKPEEPIIEMTLSNHNNSVALFDASLLDEASEEGEVDDDDLSVVSKSVVDESSKNVEEAEAMAEEMKRQLEESLAEFSNSPNASVDDMETKETTEPSANVEDELPISSSSDSVDFYTKNKILQLACHPSDPVEGDHRLKLPVVGPTLETASVSSSSSANSAVPLRRPRPAFRRRPSTASWTSPEETDTSTPKAAKSFPSLPISQQQQQLLERCVVPAVFLIVSLAICRNFFHPWLKVGNDRSTSWALTWTVLCIVAVVAPVCALEYMLLGGLLTGTVIQEALAKYPEVKKFLKDVRRMRLKAGWWYTSEVRTLRKDLEATHADMLLQQEDSSKSRRVEDDDEQDARSIQRQMSREDHRREKAQLEKVFEGERSEWYSVKDELMTKSLTEKEKSAQLQDQLETEQQKQKKLAEQKELLENNIEVERAQWKFSRASLEEALKTAVAGQQDNKSSKEFFSKMEQTRDEERNLWEKECEGFQATIQQAEEDSRRVQLEHEGKFRLFDEMRATKQSNWDSERKSLKEAVKDAIDEAKAVKDTLECQICQLMDANDAKYEKEINTVKGKFLVQRMNLEKTLEEAKGEQHVSRKCVQNLQSVLEEERSEWNSEREALEEKVRTAKAERDVSIQKLEQTETVFEGERATWPVGDEATLQQELKSKGSKIKALEESIQQLENIISIQASIEERSSKADREANKFTPVAYIVPVDADSRSIELSSSNAGNDNTATTTESSSYYSWVQKVQETHNKEKHELLKGLMSRHVQWQAANHHVGQLLVASRAVLEASVVASETPELARNFRNSLKEYTSASASAKKYMDEQTCHVDKIVEVPASFVASADDSAEITATTSSTSNSSSNTSSSSSLSSSIAKVSNPWLKNAPLWEQMRSSMVTTKTNMWSSLATINSKTSPKAAMKTICSGVFVGTGVGLGLFQLRKQQQQFR